MSYLYSQIKMLTVLPELTDSRKGTLESEQAYSRQKERMSVVEKS